MIRGTVRPYFTKSGKAVNQSGETMEKRSFKVNDRDCEDYRAIEHDGTRWLCDPSLGKLNAEGT